MKNWKFIAVFVIVGFALWKIFSSGKQAPSGLTGVGTYIAPDGSIQ